MRPLGAADVAAARAILGGEEGRHAYAHRALEILDAIDGARCEHAEYRALVAEGEGGAGGGAVTGVALYGLVAGTAGGGALYGVAVAPEARRRGNGRALVDAAAHALRGLGARFVLAELADDVALGSVARLLAASGFAEEARAADLVRDGVALRFLRRPLDAA